MCVLDDNYDERFGEPGQVLDDLQDSEEGDVDRRNVPEHSPSNPILSTCGGTTHLSPQKKQVYATRSGEPIESHAPMNSIICGTTVCSRICGWEL